jgi:hypothetical protein
LPEPIPENQLSIWILAISTIKGFLGGSQYEEKNARNDR